MKLSSKGQYADFLYECVRNPIYELMLTPPRSGTKAIKLQSERLNNSVASKIALKRAADA